MLQFSCVNITMTIVTNYSQFFSIFFLLCRIVSPDKDSADLFIESPGDGEEFVYSPVGINATLHCAVNSTILAWFIDDRLTFENPSQKLVPHSRGIYQSGPTTSMNGLKVSSVTVYGDSENNNIRICCQSFVNELQENCTTLVIYGIKSMFVKILNYVYIIYYRSAITTNTSICSKCWR